MSTKDLTIFSDLTLCLDDGEYQLTMLVHKFVLYLHCPYFEKLLTNGREKNMDNIIIMVPDTHIVRDIIMSFYSVDIKYASKKELLLHQICMDYLGLHQKKEQLEKMLDDARVVPVTEYDEYLDLITAYHYCDEYMIRMLIKIMPTDYPIAKIPLELVEKMLDSLKDFAFIYCTNTWYYVGTVDTYIGGIRSLDESVFYSNMGQIYELRILDKRNIHRRKKEVTSSIIRLVLSGNVSQLVRY